MKSESEAVTIGHIVISAVYALQEEADLLNNILSSAAIKVTNENTQEETKLPHVSVQTIGLEVEENHHLSWKHKTNGETLYYKI